MTMKMITSLGANQPLFVHYNIILSSYHPASINAYSQVANPQIWLIYMWNFFCSYSSSQGPFWWSCYKAFHDIASHCVNLGQNKLQYFAVKWDVSLYPTAL